MPAFILREVAELPHWIEDNSENMIYLGVSSSMCECLAAVM